MHYEGYIIRPPSEADSILIQVTTGCSHNRCAFCGTYKGKRFTIKDDSIIQEDIDYAAKHFKGLDRVFLCDGDALIIPYERLLNILISIEKKLPWVKRVGVYANTKSIKMKTLDQLKELKKHGLGIAYMGLETGDDVSLKNINKGASSDTMIMAGKKIREAGIELSITVLLGVAGKSRSQIHAKETGRVLSAIDPEYVGALSLMLIPSTDLYNDWENKKFELPEPLEMLHELKTMIENTDLSSGLFHANHASNYLPIRAKLPQDKERTIKLIDKAISGEIDLKPEYMRGL